MTGVKHWHVGDVIRKLREEHTLTQQMLARAAGVSRKQIVDLEDRGPDIEDVTPLEWQTLDRIAVAFGLGNGASLYKLVPENPRSGRRGRCASTVKSATRVLPFTQRSPRYKR